MALIGAPGTTAFSSAASRSSRFHKTVFSTSVRSISTRFVTLAGLVAKRGSAARSGRSIAAHSRGQKPSCGMLTLMKPSAVANAWSGTMFGRALPAGCGAVPVARYSARRVVPAVTTD